MTGQEPYIFTENARVHRIRHLMRDAALKEMRLPWQMRFGSILIIIAVMAFIGWATQAQLDEAAVAKGQIVPSGTVRSLQHLEGGIVGDILVTQGQLVEQGQPLIRFKGQDSISEFEKLTLRHASLKLRIARLEAFAAGQPFTVPVDLGVARTSGRLQAIIRAEQQTYQSQRNNIQSQFDTIDQQVVVFQSEIDSWERELTIKQQVAVLAEDELDMFSDLLERKNASRIKVLQAQRKLMEVRADIESLRGQIATNKQRIQELRTNKSSIEKDAAEQANEQITDMSVELAELTEVLDHWDDRVGRLVLKAPMRGIVQNIAAKSVGAVISPGEDVITLVPVDEALLAEVELQPKDIGFVKPGLNVELKFDTYNFTRFGAVQGVVEQVSPSTFVDEQANPFYKVRISLSQGHVGTDAAQNLILPGMTLQADILTGRKTIMEYLLKPIYTNLQEGLRER